MGQLVLVDVPVERWVINPYKHGLLDGPGDGMVSWGAGRSQMGEGALRRSFSLSPKVLADSPMYSC